MLAIEGDSGIGKTAFIRHCAFLSTGATVLWARADQAESDFGYGVVMQPIRDVEGRLLDKFPLLTGGTVYQASSFAVGAERLGVIGELQATGPSLAPALGAPVLRPEVIERIYETQRTMGVQGTPNPA